MYLNSFAEVPFLCCGRLRCCRCQRNWYVKVPEDTSVMHVSDVTKQHSAFKYMYTMSCMQHSEKHDSLAFVLFNLVATKVEFPGENIFVVLLFWRQCPPILQQWRAKVWKFWRKVCLWRHPTPICVLYIVYLNECKLCWSFIDQGFFEATPAVAEDITCATLTRKIYFTWKSLFVVKGQTVASLSGVPAPTSSGCALPASSDGMPCWRLGLGTLIVLSARNGKSLLK